MGISVGDTLPDARMTRMGADGPEVVQLKDALANRKVVLFALPGAYTGPCSTIHLPSFIKTADQFRERGVDDIICVAVNDPFTLAAWAKDTGADAAGITMLADAEGQLTNALDMAFTAPPLGLIGRSNRYAVIAENGVVTHASVDEPGVCDISTGDKFLATL